MTISNSARTSILRALAEAFKIIDGTGDYKTNLYSNSFPKLKFWDEVTNFPAIYMSAGSESREYLPGSFKWGFLGISLKLYVRGEDPSLLLEELLEDVERVLDANRTLVYDVNTPGAQTVEILINSIVTDEGLLEPHGVGEVNIIVQYPVL
jgi:hypothetical protein